MPILAAPTSGPAGNFILNVSTTVSQPAFNVSSGTVTTQLSLPYLIAGQCASINSAGQVVSTPCGSGAASIAVTTGNASGFLAILSSPTAVINFDSTTFNLALKGGATIYVLPNPSSVTLQGNNLAATYLTNSSATATYLMLSSATANYITLSSAAATYFNGSGVLAVAHGGTGTPSPGLIAGTNITSITGSWPNQTINAATQGGGAGGTTILPLPSGASNYIQNTSSLQQGATFYVSSGTVGGPFTVTGGAVISTITSTNGSTFGLVINSSGTAGNIYGFQSNINDSASDNFGGDISATGASSINFALRLNANGGTNNHAIYVNSGDIEVSGANVGTPGQVFASNGPNQVPVWTSNLPYGSSNYVWITNSLQPSSTYYVSSGTVNGNLYVGGNTLFNPGLTIQNGHNVILQSADGTSNSTLNNTGSSSNSQMYITAPQGMGINMTPSTSYDLLLTSMSVTSITVTGAATISSATIGTSNSVVPLTVYGKGVNFTENGSNPTVTLNWFGNVSNLHATNFSSVVGVVQKPAGVFFIDDDSKIPLYVETASHGATEGPFVVIGSSSNLTGRLAFAGTTAGVSQYVALRAPSGVSLSGDTWVLPSADGTPNQSLVTDGSHNLSFQTISGGGGASALAIYNGAPQVSSPTAIINFSSNSFYGALQVGSTASITLLPVSLSTGVIGNLAASSLSGIVSPNNLGAISLSSQTINSVSISTGTNGILDGSRLAGNSTSYVWITNSLQASSTFYVSSGTIATQLNTGQINVNGTGTNWPDVYTFSGSTYSSLKTSTTITVGFVPVALDSWATVGWVALPAGGGGGGSSLAVTSGSITGITVNVSSPTALVVFDSRTVSVQLTGSATAYVSLLASSVTLMGQSINASVLSGIISPNNLPSISLSTGAFGVPTTLISGTTGLTMVTAANLAGGATSYAPNFFMVNLSTGVIGILSPANQSAVSLSTGMLTPMVSATSITLTAAMTISSNVNMGGNATNYYGATGYVQGWNISGGSVTVRNLVFGNVESDASGNLINAQVSLASQTIGMLAGSQISGGATSYQLIAQLVNGTTGIQGIIGPGNLPATSLSSGTIGNLPLSSVSGILSPSNQSAVSLSTGMLTPMITSTSMTIVNAVQVSSNATLSGNTTFYYGPVGMYQQWGINGGSVTVYSPNPTGTALVVMTTNNVAGFSVSNTTTTGGDFLLDISSVPNNTGFRVFGVDTYGHIVSTGTAPIATSCGTSPVLKGTDLGFTVSPGATATGCTITFANAFTLDPTCLVKEETMSLVNALTYTHSTTQVIITQTGAATETYDVICVGKRGP